MRLLFRIICFLAIAVCQSQNISGTIRDSLSNKPIAYTNLSVLNSNYGTATDSLGQFILNIGKHTNDTLFVSALGYKPKQIPLNTFVEKTEAIIIKLSENQTALDEVVINTKKKKYTTTRTLGIKRQKVKFKSSVPFGYERCLYIKNESLVSGKVAWVAFKLKKKKIEDYDMYPTYFRVKFYEFDTVRKRPGKPISSFDTIIKPKNDNQRIKILLKDEFVPFLKSGICVSLEAINPQPNHPKKSMYVTTPNLLMTYDEEPLTWSSYRGQSWTHMTRKMQWKSFGKVKHYYMNPLVQLGVKYEK
ncbi:carboxypeptidase-like regulatory domain-containing protein [Mangrovimonas spongiae]|uniref:Carboxypeptidase-like regulatory domain-containing protein n=1 Tax=Mangrovimonas spongiae TaxID=2494697 RepID=A0A3R9NR42_9FLAO|nr:carboxypeptidase-like regulatory domain-containing protein [Mangrovimonas spongiae]RSK39801.1 carboxypeptidase-like regulatory domain-containing protein [Mangrovimonas spongiae]